VKTFQTKAYRVKFPAGDGAHQLAGIIDRPVTDADHRPPVVVYSHCFTCNKDLKATVRISRALAARGVAVLRFDMTGLGGSGGQFSDSNFTTNLADLAAAIRFADQELGPVTSLVGHSFGGIASLVTAARAAQGDANLALDDLGFVATLAAPSDTTHLADLLERMAPAIASDGSGAVTIGGLSWTITRQMVDDFRRHDVTQELPHVRCPVLLMHSPVDETVGYDHAIRLMTLIQSRAEPQPASQPDTQPGGSNGPWTPVSLVTLAGADHLLAKNPLDRSFVAEMLSAWCHRH